MKPSSKSHLQVHPCSLFKKFTSMILLGMILIVLLEVIESSSIVKTLPGFYGDLHVKLETGYIGVGESEDMQLFYYFVESEGNPKEDPLMFMLSGGPGCSGLNKILSGTGPFHFNYANSSLEKPVLEINPYSWTKVANVISVDHPVGTGFSYAENPEAYTTNDTLSSMLAYQFLRKWFVDHPTFLKNPLYIGADSYGGLVVPMIVEEIYKVNEVEEGPRINIKGYVLGNGVTDSNQDYNSRIPFAHHMALLSDAIYKSTNANCGGEYLNVDPRNTQCILDLNVVDKSLEKIKHDHILEPYCDTSINLNSSVGRGLRSLEKTPMNIWPLRQADMQGCRDDKSMYPYVWANRRDVREALHIREVFNETEWVACNGSLQFEYFKEPISYTHNVLSTVAYHRDLTNKNCRALVYSGDHDMTVSYLSTLNWIESLNLLVLDNWRPWFVDEQVAGYTLKYANNDYNLTYATLKGGGHIATDYKPKECFKMLMRWLANDAL